MISSIEDRLLLWSQLQDLKEKTGDSSSAIISINGDEFWRIVLTIAYAITNQCAYFI